MRSFRDYLHTFQRITSPKILSQRDDGDGVDGVDNVDLLPHNHN